MNYQLDNTSHFGVETLGGTLCLVCGSVAGLNQTQLDARLTQELRRSRLENDAILIELAVYQGTKGLPRGPP